MSDTKKDKAKILRKISREQNKLPQGKTIPDKKRTYKRKPKNKREEAYDALCYVPVGPH